jgi:hypothetical protein
MPLFSRGEGGGRSRREQFGEAWASPPRQTAWQIIPGERLELRDSGGALIAWMRGDRTLSGVRDPAGRLLVTFKPAIIKQLFSASNIAQLAVEGAVFGDTDVNAGPSRGGPANAPGLDLHDVSTGITFAQVAQTGPGGSPAAYVGLLPAGRLNDRVIGRSLGPSDVARIRQGSPLLYALAPDGAAQLSDPLGRVVARLRDAVPVPAEGPQQIEIVDNDLPAPWLFAIVLGCRHGPR